jgi:hypothetical protein
MIKRISDWFEKMSAAFMVGAVLADTDAFVAVGFSIICLSFALYLTKKGGQND